MSGLRPMDLRSIRLMSGLRPMDLRSIRLMSGLRPMDLQSIWLMSGLRPMDLRSIWLMSGLRPMDLRSIYVCTGTRIRTQIKGFGDLYTNRCTMPVFISDKAKSYPGHSGQLLLRQRYKKIDFSTLFASSDFTRIISSHQIRFGLAPTT
jgi:hypothetical protein